MVATILILRSSVNRYPILTVIIWYLSVALLGIRLSILRFAFSGLSDRGYREILEQLACSSCHIWFGLQI